MIGSASLVILFMMFDRITIAVLLMNIVKFLGGFRVEAKPYLVQTLKNQKLVNQINVSNCLMSNKIFTLWFTCTFTLTTLNHCDN